MTREEAITELKLFKESVIPWDVPILLTAIDVAVEALQTPPMSQRSMYQAGYRQGQKDRPKGKWIDTEFEKLKKCSRCGTEWGIYSIEEFDFCPSCGADMRGNND